MSRRVVSALSRVVDHRASRRGFLSRSAMGATALAVAPVTYALRPTTALAAICSCAGSACDCGSGCCDGYTDFCCQLTGENLCPPNTIVAGHGMPTALGAADFSPEALQRRLPGQAGMQRFFRAADRAFGLYVVLGSVRSVELLVPEANRSLGGITIT